MDSFKQFYFEEGIKSFLSRLGNKFTNLFKSIGEYSLYTSELPIFVNISEDGFKKLVDKFAQKVEIDDWKLKKSANMELDRLTVSDRGDKQSSRASFKRHKMDLRSEDRIVKMYRGILKDSHSIIPDDFEPYEISVYETGIGGIIAVMIMKHSETDVMKYYVGCDGKGNKFINSVLGMSLGTFASLNRADKVKKGFADIHVDKDKDYTSDVEEDDLSYLDRLKRVGEKLTDSSNKNMYAVMEANVNQYNFVRRKLNVMKKPVIINTNNLGKALLYKLNNTESVYLFELRNDYSDGVEYLIIYEAPTKDNFESMYSLYFDRNKKTDIEWFKGLDIINLPSF